MPIIRLSSGLKRPRMIGFLDVQNHTFCKKVWKSKHLFKIYDAWGIDAKYFTDVLVPNDYKIQVWEREDDILYEISALKFKKNVEYFHFKNQNEDHRSQAFCARRNWDKLTKDEYEARAFYFQHCI